MFISGLGAEEVISKFLAHTYFIVKISNWMSGCKMGYYKRIRDLREDHDMSQRKLAEQLNMAQSQYWLYEKGYRDISTDVLIALADLYGTSTDYILGRTNDPTFKKK